MNKILINCPYSEKDIVKKLGALWSPEEKSWYITSDIDSSLFSKWLDNDNKKGIKGIGGLYVDLVPQNCFYSNVRSLLSNQDWNLIRKKVYKDNNFKCEICHRSGNQHPVEAHERWIFDLASKTQILKKIESLCPACHEATHLGLAQVNGRGNIAKKRLMYVNNWNSKETEEHIKDAFVLWNQRNNINWSLDISWLINFISLSNESIKIIEDLKNKKIIR
jgi:hypothetical protein